MVPMLHQYRAAFEQLLITASMTRRQHVELAFQTLLTPTLLPTTGLPLAPQTVQCMLIGWLLCLVNML